MKTLTVVSYRLETEGTLPNGHDACVMCGEDSGVCATVPVDLRNFYVKGQGQLCLRCAGKTGLVEFPLGVKRDDPWTGRLVKK